MNAVENKSLPALGPAPVRSGAPGRAMSGQRAAVLERLQSHGGAATVASLTEELGLHPNTVREHLEALVDAGLVVRSRGTTGGRGRPAWEYTAAADVVETDVRLRDYAGLTAALAAHLERTSPDAAADAREIGRAWGFELAAEEAPGGVMSPDDGELPSRAKAAGHRPAPGDPAARQQAVVLLTRLGFAPDADRRATTAALRRCPLLDVARKHPDVVCNVHLGIVQGALAGYGGDPDPARLLPFAEPGACRLHLAAPRGLT